MKEDLVFTAIVIIALIMTSTGCQRASSPSTSPNSATPSAQQLTLINELRKLTEAQCGTKAEAIDVDASLETQGCDDLDVVELIMTVEEKYKITISDDQIERATINNLARIINKR